jgi:hypothetical protein
MTWLGMLAIIAGSYLALKVAGFMLKLVLWAVIVVAGYWWLAPSFGWPPLAEVVQILWG